MSYRPCAIERRPAVCRRGQITLVPPFFESFGKRLVKTPKLYFLDSGLACHLLGIESERMLSDSPFYAPIFEAFIQKCGRAHALPA